MREADGGNSSGGKRTRNGERTKIRNTPIKEKRKDKNSKEEGIHIVAGRKDSQKEKTRGKKRSADTGIGNVRNPTDWGASSEWGRGKRERHF